jgi:hypothetical protein
VDVLTWISKQNKKKTFSFMVAFDISKGKNKNWSNRKRVSRTEATG